MEEFLKGFGINWKLLLAQLANFALLFFIFKKWLLKPILRVLDKRKEIIEGGIKKAKEIDQKLAKIEELKKIEMEKMRLEMEKILEDSKKRGEILQREMILDAEKRAEKVFAGTKIKIEVEKEKIRDDLKKEFSNLLILSLEKILKKEYTPKDQERILSEVEEEIKK